MQDQNTLLSFILKVHEASNKVTPIIKNYRSHNKEHKFEKVRKQTRNLHTL